jgi:hypothetical protein
MANEARISLTLEYSKAGAVFRRSSSLQATVSGTVALQYIQNIGTTDETLDLGGATPGFVFLHNLDATNYIVFGTDGSNYANKLKAGEAQIVRWNAAAIHAKANSSACDLEVLLIAD